MDSSIIFIDSSGKTVIYHGEFTPFSTGPVLHRYQDCLLFSFFNYKNNTFGISRIDSNQLCGFSASIFKMYSIKEPLEEIRLGDTLIHGEFYKIFPDKDSFLIVIYGFDDPPEFWKVIAK